MGKIIDGDASVEKPKVKKGLAKIFGDFIAEDSGNIGKYVWKDVIVPSVKKTISEATKGSIDMLLYGHSAPTQSTAGRTVKKINYSGSFVGSDEPEIDTLPQSNIEFDSITFKNKEDVYAIIRQAREVIKRSGIVTVANIYDWAGIASDNFMTTKFGWRSVEDAKIYQMPDGTWQIKFAKPMALD